MVLTCKECICYDNIADSGKIKCKLFDELINIRKLKKCNELEKYLIKKDVDIDSDNINELVDKIVEGNRDKINNNNSFQLLLDKVSEESNRNNAILKEIVEALKIIQNQMQNI
nr:hypothetical protein [Actinomycetota bacterium]